MAQWRERPPPTNVSRVRFPDPASYLGEFVVGSLPCSERFLSGYSGSPLSSKTNISKFQFDLVLSSTLSWVGTWCLYHIVVIYCLSLSYSGLPLFS